MKTKTKSKLQTWAIDRCKAWNWNCNVAEIARELINADVDPDGYRFAVLGDEFVKFFGAAGEHEEADAKNNWQIIGQIIEEFA